MISIIITTYKEEKTLPQTIEKILEENLIDYEMLIVGPDEETEKITKNFENKYPQIKYLKDNGLGKPTALNLAFQKAKGDIFILTDGDVFIEKGAIEKLLKHFKDEKIGAVSGCPISINQRENLFGYWSRFLTNAADFIRRKKSRAGEYLVCSGYLYAIRRDALCNREGNLIKIPEDTLVEDSIISQIIWQNGYKITYEPEARVNVKFPTNFSDWLKQKIRATGGYVHKSQITNLKSPTSSGFKVPKMRSFCEELKDGLKLFFTYPKNLKEFWWTFLLYLARLYLWFLIFWQIRIFRKPLAKVWQRVESTKFLFSLIIFLFFDKLLLLL